MISFLRMRLAGALATIFGASLISFVLLRVLPGWSCPPLPVHFVTPTARLRSARVRAFQDWVREVLSRQVWCAAPPLPGR